MTEIKPGDEVTISLPGVSDARYIVTMYRNGDHCWLEVGRGWGRIIADITADQVPGLYHPVCSTFGDLCAFRISYIAERRLTADEVLNDPVQPRLAILTEALS